MNHLRGFPSAPPQPVSQRAADRDLPRRAGCPPRTHIADNLRGGDDPRRGPPPSLLKLGGLEQPKKSVRDARNIRFLETLLQDVRFGFRLLKRNPGYASVAILAVALGIGANTAIYSIVYATACTHARIPSRATRDGCGRRSKAIVACKLPRRLHSDWHGENGSFFRPWGRGSEESSNLGTRAGRERVQAAMGATPGFSSMMGDPLLLTLEERRSWQGPCRRPHVSIVDGLFQGGTATAFSAG